MYTNTTLQHQKKQENKRLFLIPQKNYDELLVFCRSLTSIERAIFNQIIAMSNKCRYVYPSQRTLGRAAGCSREYVNKVIKKLEDLELLGTIYRHRTTCYYKISAIFTNPYVRTLFSGFFTALKTIPFWFLSLSDIYSVPFDSSQFTPRDLSNRKNNIITKGHSKKGSAIGGKRPTKIQKERKVMDAKYDFPEYTTKIADYLGFSPWARVKMLPFHELVLRRACKATKDRSPNDKFGYFLKLCNEFSKQLGFTIDRNLEAIASSRTNMPSDAPMLKKDMPRESWPVTTPLREERPLFLKREGEASKPKGWVNPYQREVDMDVETIKFFQSFREMEPALALAQWRTLRMFDAHLRYGPLPEDLK